MRTSTVVLRPGRWPSALSVLLVLAVGTSCGNGSSSTQSVTSSPPEGGTSSGGQPSGSSGGSTGGSTGTGTPSTTGTGPDNSSSTSTSPQPGTSTPPQTGGGAGGASVAPPPPDDCAGLLPDTVASPVEVVLGSQSTCGPATTDPSGHVTLGLWNGFAWQMTPYSLSGSPQGVPMQPLSPAGGDVDRWFHWTASGFRGILRGATQGMPTMLQTWDVTGHATQTGGRVVTITPDGRGGTVAVVPDPSSPPYVVSPPLFLQWLDPSGVLTRSVSLDNDVGAVVVNWSTGHVFALVYGRSSRATQGRWYDGNGAPLTAWFALDVAQGTGTVWHFLMDGTLVLAGPTGDWVAATKDGVEGPGAVPDWLKARPNSRLATIRNGRGYAVLWNGVTDRFEVVSTSGKTCGTVTLPAVGSPLGTAPPRLDVGQDGTLLHSAGPAGAPGLVNAACTFRWWPGLLR